MQVYVRHMMMGKLNIEHIRNLGILSYELVVNNLMREGGEGREKQRGRGREGERERKRERERELGREEVD